MTYITVYGKISHILREKGNIQSQKWIRKEKHIHFALCISCVHTALSTEMAKHEDDPAERSRCRCTGVDASDKPADSPGDPVHMSVSRLGGNPHGP